MESPKQWAFRWVSGGWEVGTWAVGGGGSSRFTFAVEGLQSPGVGGSGKQDGLWKGGNTSQYLQYFHRSSLGKGGQHARKKEQCGKGAEL